MNICEADITPGCLLLIPKRLLLSDSDSTEVQIGLIQKIVSINAVDGPIALIRFPHLSLTAQYYCSTIEQQVNSELWELIKPKNG